MSNIRPRNSAPVAMPLAEAATVSVSGSGPAAVAVPSADGRDDYTVTELAGPKVAGRRVAHGETLRLTGAEAQDELLSGTIVRKGEAPHAMFARPATDPS